MSDGNLGQIFQKRLPKAHWQRIETLVGRGTPDLNGCLDGKEFWIENKSTSGWVVKFEDGQVAWHERRCRAGGRTFIAVRRQANAGPRRGDACDELWLFHGQQAREVASDGLRGVRPMTMALGWWAGGPARWGWDQVRQILVHH